MSSNNSSDIRGQPLRFEFFSPKSPQQAVEMSKENKWLEVYDDKPSITKNNEGKITKTIKFINKTTNENVDMPWPKSRINEDIEPSSKISELGRIFIHYLNHIGIVKSDLSTPTLNEKTSYKGKEYSCLLKFQIKYNFQRFQVVLALRYGIANKKVFSKNAISNDELVDYLKDLIILQKIEPYGEIKYKNLKLLTIDCHINGLELEI